MVRLQQISVAARYAKSSFLAKPDYGRANRERLMDEALSVAPGTISLDVRLLLLIEGKQLHSTYQNSQFKFTLPSMTWQNIDRVEWTSIMGGTVPGLEFLHPVTCVSLGKTIFDEPLTIGRGTHVAFVPGAISVGVDVLAGHVFAREDYEITEEPDEIDWQSMLTNAAAKPMRKRRWKK